MYICCRKGVGNVSGGRGSRETEGYCEEHLKFIPEFDNAVSNMINCRLNEQSLIPDRGKANTDIVACLLGFLLNQ
jgi:hypothetical protein